MSRKNKGIFSVGAVALFAMACGGASTPPSDTPASTGAGAQNAANVAGESTPAGQAAASSTSEVGAGAGAQDAANVAGESTPAGQAAASSTSEVGAPEGQPDPVTGQTHGQRPSSGSAQSPSGSDVATLAASTSTATTSTATLDDAQIAEITDSVNSAEIEQATLARERTQNPEVRRFASMMIEHHGEAQKKQASLKLQTADSPLSRQLREESKTTLQSLAAKHGADFDRAYLDAQVAGHQKVLETIGRVLAPQARKPELRTYLTELEPTVAQHLQQARSARESVQGGSGKTSSR